MLYSIDAKTAANNTSMTFACKAFLDGWHVGEQYACLGENNTMPAIGCRKIYSYPTAPNIMNIPKEK
jgi:hypothetical protein